MAADGDGRLERCAAEGAAAWPTLHVDRVRFLGYLRERAGDDPNRLRAGDLYLACACVDGDARAAALLDERYLARLPNSLVRADLPAAAVDEAMSVLRERLLVAPPGGRARLCDYVGTGELGAWLRVVAVRETLTLLRRGRREVPLSEPLMQALPGVVDDPELTLLKARYRVEFEAAFAEALAALTPRERNLLRHQLVHELNVDQIGALYRVHRATAARWVDAARTRLQAATHDGMMARLRLDRGAVESIMRLIRSQIDVSVCGHLSVEDEE
jgi:RNA polymerase sigma-70 factor (ECF subfamily)